MSCVMKEHAQATPSQQLGTESCGVSGQPAPRSVDREVAGRNRKVKELGLEISAVAGAEPSEIGAGSTTMSEKGEGVVDPPGSETTASDRRRCAGTSETRPSPSLPVRVGTGEETETGSDGRSGVSLARITEEAG